MTPRFEVGEIAVFIGGYSMSPEISARVGMECEITHPLGALDLHCAGYGIKFQGDTNQCYAIETYLRKRPQPGDQIQKFRETLIPCDDLYRKRLYERLNPAPAPATLEARIARVFPSLDELNKRQQVFCALYGIMPLWGFDE